MLVRRKVKIVSCAYTWDERCFHLLADQLLPSESLEPRMVLHVFRAVQSKPIRWLALDQLMIGEDLNINLIKRGCVYSVSEISCFE